MIMMDNMIDLLTERIQAGLQRSSVRTCAQWACQYRYMAGSYRGQWSFEHHPWLYQMHLDQSESIVGQKSAQMGYTEWLLNNTFYSIDVLGQSVLYILPSDSDASDFSASRFDPALQLSDHLANLFSDVRNVGHKRAGGSNLFVRGSRSRSKLKSLPANGLVFDEVDEMKQDNIPLAIERTSGQIDKWFRYISTPTIEGYGINKRYDQSTQNHYMFRCPHCNRWIELKYPESLIITADTLLDPRIKDTHLICYECKHPLSHEAKTEYLHHKVCRHIPTYTDRDTQGYYINQMYSCTIPPYLLAQSYLRGLTNPADEQEFYNSKLGLTHAPKGGKITDAIIAGLQTDSLLIQPSLSNDEVSSKLTANRIRTMGTDVGTYLHTVIHEWTIPQASADMGSVDINVLANPRLIATIKQKDFDQLDVYMRKYKVNYHVIDANPERRKALEHAQRCEGYVKLCFYGNGVSGHKIHVADDSLYTITVDRTSWIDMALGRYHDSRIRLPQDLDLEFKKHLTSPVRIFRKDADGNPVAVYVSSDDDHFAHASTYAEIALQMAVANAQNRNIDIPL